VSFTYIYYADVYCFITSNHDTTETNVRIDHYIKPYTPHRNSVRSQLWI